MFSGLYSGFRFVVFGERFPTGQRDSHLVGHINLYRVSGIYLKGGY